MRLGKQGQYFFVTDFETTGLADDDQPVEVGIVACDHEMRAVDQLSTVIVPERWCRDATWGRRDLGAFRVHGIHPSEVEESGVQRAVAAAAVVRLAERYGRPGQKPVLVSDNVQFEWGHMDRLLRVVGRTCRDVFHYCGWDTSLLLEATGVGDPVPVHRALGDAGRLHAAVVRALDRVRHLGGSR